VRIGLVSRFVKTGRLKLVVYCVDGGQEPLWQIALKRAVVPISGALFIASLPGSPMFSRHALPLSSRPPASQVPVADLSSRHASAAECVPKAALARTSLAMLRFIARSPASYHPSPVKAQTKQIANAPLKTKAAISLPIELWGEIARFSSRRDVLNLRTINAEMKFQADTAITSITLAGNTRVRAFADAQDFQHIERLQVSYIDSATLQYLATSLAKDGAIRCRHRPILELKNAEGDLADGLITLSQLPLGKLRFDDMHLMDTKAVNALAACNFPVDLTASFLPGTLPATSCIATLSSLSAYMCEFTDDMAKRFASHGALESLYFCPSASFSSRGIEDLASLAKLRCLWLDYNGTPNPIDLAAASALAANPRLESLHIAQLLPSFLQRRFQLFSAESFAALSDSQSLKTLQMPIGPGMHSLGNLKSLESLELDGRFPGCPLLSTETARCFAQLNSLKSLKLVDVGFERDALSLLLGVHHARHVHLEGVCVDGDVLSALLSKRGLKTLSIARGKGGPLISDQHLAVLLRQPGLERLHVDNVQYARLPGSAILALVRQAPSYAHGRR